MKILTVKLLQLIFTRDSLLADKDERIAKFL